MKAPEDGQITIRHRPALTVTLSICNPYGPVYTHLEARVKWTGWELKKAIEQRLQKPEAGDQSLRFRGDELEDDLRLCQQGIIGDCAINLLSLINIKSFFQDTCHEREVDSNMLLEMFLSVIANNINEDTVNLRFAIKKASGPVADLVQNWLPDRGELFAAIDAVGTLQENGFMKGDEIQVFRKRGASIKRKRIPDLVEPNPPKKPRSRWTRATAPAH